MVNCPKCNGNIEEDFGLVTCPNCGEAVLLGDEGEDQRTRVFETTAEPEPDSRGDSGATMFPDVEFKDDDAAQESSEFLGEEPSIAERVEGYNDNDSSSSQNVQGDDESRWPSPSDEMIPQYQLENFESEPKVDLGVMPEVPEDEEPEEVTVNLKDVADYGNSPESSASEGILRYDIIIQGIDTAEIREDLREALIDERLMWDVDGILGRIELGRVEIKNVSAVKASVVVNRIKTLPNQIKWRQSAIYV